MAKVITLSRTFPSYHPKSGHSTYFVEQVLNAFGIQYLNDSYFHHLKELNKKPLDEGKLTKKDIYDFWYSLKRVYLRDKLHTIRAKSVNKKTGDIYSRWKKGDKASLRVWSGIPYNSPQIIIAPDVELVRVGDFRILKDAHNVNWIDIGGKYSYPAPLYLERSIIPNVAENDGLSTRDLLRWFKYPKPFEGQILCWKEVGYV